jgi:predicted amidohydrolase
MPDERTRSTARVACVQLTAHDIEDSDLALEEALSAIAEAASIRADLVVLPECTYPAYVLADPVEHVTVRDDVEVQELFGQAARERGVWLAVGLAQGWRPGGTDARNAALLFAPDGTVRLRTAKRFLWDFDRTWFTPGGPADPIPWLGTAGMDASALGMLVCADARMPEVARSLAVAGASLILDPTAWVATGRDSASLSNPQPEYLMSVRALENGVWIAAADKVGMERGSVVYAGKSCIVAPDGSVVAMASSDQPQIVWADLDLSTATGPPVPRRPELYGPIADDRLRSEAAARLATPIAPAERSVRVGLLQSTSSIDAAAVRARIQALGSTSKALQLDVVAAVMSGADDTDDAILLARSVSSDLGVATAIGVVGGDGRIARLHVCADGLLHTAARTHGSDADTTGPLDGRTTDIGPLRVGAMVGPEGLVPEVARVLTLAGSELVFWAADGDTSRALEVARVRALENRVWVGLLAPGGPAGDAIAALIDPDGRVTSIGLRDRDHLVSGVVDVAAARLKEMAPGTDVLQGRQPETYAILTRDTRVTA